FDVVVAASVLHHLRGEPEWAYVFRKVFHALRPGGSFWIADHIEQSEATIQALMTRRWADHLVALKGEAYRDHVFAYVQHEDTPRPLVWQLDLLRKVGFAGVDVLHKNNLFASFGGRTP